MARFDVYDFGSLNLKISPFLQKEGDLIRCVNFEKDMIGSLKKRPGYTDFLGTADGSAVQDLFSWTKNDGTSTYVYRKSGTKIYYYNVNGTATDWTICGNGTLNTNHVGHAVLANTLFIDQASGTYRYTTNGTAFTDGSAAPPGEFMTEYLQRIYVGSANTLFYSTTGDGTNWQTSGTSDSSSLDMPGAGQINQLFTCNNQVTISKNSGLMLTWDEFNLRQVPTEESFTSPYSLKQKDDYFVGLNRMGVQGFNGDRPELLSNVIEKQIFNDSGSAIAGTTFDNAPGDFYLNNYFLAVGTVTDDLTNETVSDCILKYNYLLNEWSNYQFANNPTAFTKYVDGNSDSKFIFGDKNGQCYTFGTGSNDSGEPIQSLAELVVHMGTPSRDKSFERIDIFASPGCQAQIQIAVSDTFRRDGLNWMEVGDLKSGFARFRFPSNRGKLLHFKVVENSNDPAFHLYGFTLKYEMAEK